MRLAEIYAYSIERFGAVQAERYLKQLEGTFLHVARLPIGHRASPGLGEGLHKVVHRSHSIYYQRTEGGGVFIVRVLHNAMDAATALD